MACSTRLRNHEAVGICARLAREHFLILLEYACAFTNHSRTVYIIMFSYVIFRDYFDLSIKLFGITIHSYSH